MEHEVIAQDGGVVRRVDVSVGDTVTEGQVLAIVEPGDHDGDGASDRGAAGRSRRATGRSQSGPRAPRDRARRGAARRGRKAPRAGAPDRPREPRRPRRRGDVRRVRTVDLRRAGAATLQAGTDRAHARRRAGRRRRGHRPQAVGRDVLRLHGAGRHPGDAQPPEEGPAVRGRRAPPAAGGPVRRGRRRAPRRRRLAARRRPRLPRVQPVRPAQRTGPARRDRVGLLLCGQRRAARLLRRGDRDRGLEHRDGRPGDDRGRRPRRVRARRGRADRRAVRQRGRRPARARRRRGGRRDQALPVVLPGRQSTRRSRKTSARCAT